MLSRIALSVLGLLVAVAQAQPRRHDQIIAVPAAKAPAIDGRLDDWDLSGEIVSAFDDALAPKFTVCLAVMYDRDALYLSARFVDTTPLHNAHDPAIERDRGWAGDCLQIRLCTDPVAACPLARSNDDSICHLTMWYCTDRKLPVLHVARGMDYHGTKAYTGADSGLAFRLDAPTKPGGKPAGYTLEARVPWERLAAKGRVPEAGDRLAMVCQPLWSDATGTKHVCTYHDVVRRAGFSFQDCRMWGRLVLSAKGRLAAADRPKDTPRRRFGSPTGVAGFDRVAVLDRAAVSVRRRKDGYPREASVPPGRPAGAACLDGAALRLGLRHAAAHRAVDGPVSVQRGSHAGHLGRGAVGIQHQCHRDRLAAVEARQDLLVNVHGRFLGILAATSSGWPRRSRTSCPSGGGPPGARRVEDAPGCP